MFKPAAKGARMTFLMRGTMFHVAHWRRRPFVPRFAPKTPRM
jgi:hypothetical protein